MHCKQARSLLLRSVDHGVPADELHAVHHHIAECAECRRFAEGMHVWPSQPARSVGAGAPDLTERVLANVRPLPPPWVYRQQQQSRQVPHLVAFVVGALGVSLAFLMLCLTFVVAVSGNTAPQSGRQQQLLVPEVWRDVRVWMNSIPGDTAHTVVTLALSMIFVVLAVSWVRTLAVRVGHDRQ
ncbi:MAG: zf-HC2 domain-containing protein [Thermomicrobiales bacterium]